MQLKSLKRPPILPRPYKKPNFRGRICTFDTETDPFAHGSSIEPFTCGFYDGETYVDFWGDDCIEQFAAYMHTRRNEQLLVYCHNWGGFDVHFCYDHLDDSEPMLMIGARIAKCKAFGQEFRDSYKLAAVKLADYQKDEFDYTKLLKNRREEFKEEIRSYQRGDCIYLHSLVTGFGEVLGDRITIGNAAINMLQDTQSFERMNEAQDKRIRPFFFGGRTQCIERGVIDDDWKVYDVNSMYPFIMATVRHPISAPIHKGRTMGDKTAFVRLTGWNNMCLPQRGGIDLNFTEKYGEFWASIHEVRAGLEAGTLRIQRIHETLDFNEWATFHDFILPLYEARLEAKARGDKLMDIYYKLMMNNAYGKFAQDPERYEDHCFTRTWETPEGGAFDAVLNPNGWKPKHSNGTKVIWTRSQNGRRKNYFNVATGASITGAARAYLHRALVRADRPVYCDTDSIICRGLPADIDPKRLGAWKLEASGTRIAIAGKKTYALFDGEAVVKKASKGVGLTAHEILRVAQGEEILYKSETPTFTLDGKTEYLERKIRATG